MEQMQQGFKQGPTNESDLLASLLKAKKVMNKVDTGEFQRGFVNEGDLIAPTDEFPNTPTNITPAQPNRNVTRSVKENMNVDRINASNLPDNIKEAMIKNPIPDVKMTDGLNVDLLTKAKRLMENDGVGNGTASHTKQVKSFTSQRGGQTQQTQPSMLNEQTLMLMIEPLIENIVRKTINEVLDKKLDQVLSAKDTLAVKENLVLKVGNSIFQGKILSVKKVK